MNVVLDPAAQKTALRRRMIDLRAARGGDRAQAARNAAAHFRRAIAPARGAVIAAYYAIKGELDPAPLLATLAEAGHVVALPVVEGKGRPLAFRAWTPGRVLEPGPFGTFHPEAGAPAVFPDIAVVPLLAFDRRGHRLGYGAGYYDRTIAAFAAKGPLLTVGFAFADQEVPEVPIGPTDRRLDWIVTETGALEAMT